MEGFGGLAQECCEKSRRYDNVIVGRPMPGWLENSTEMRYQHRLVDYT
jgi:hypothetical protein